MPAPPLSARRAHYQTLFTSTLPRLARSKDPAQPSWPVTLDHCFGRIILDKVIGEGQTAWTEKLKGPAIRNMTDEQIEKCIELGEQIASGEVDLVELDEESLRSRGKRSKVEKVSTVSESEGKLGKRKRAGDADQGIEESPGRKGKKGKINGEMEEGGGGNAEEDEDAVVEKDQQLANMAKKTEDLEEERHLIEQSSLADYRKKVLLALCQVPRGKYTTYAEISKFLSSSPRAVGNAMRNNPFAPAVPCHRVLAADGKIGGYGGQWGEGELVKTKRKLLREEGLRFDGKGKVVGRPFSGFK